MKNHYTLMNGILKIFSLLAFMMLLPSTGTAKKISRYLSFKEYDYGYVTCGDDSRWRVSSDGDVKTQIIPDSYGEDFLLMEAGSQMTLTSEEVFPREAKITVCVASAQYDEYYSSSECNIYCEGQSQRVYMVRWSDYQGNPDNMEYNECSFDLNRNEDGTLEFDVTFNYYGNTGYISIKYITVEYDFLEPIIKEPGEVTFDGDGEGLGKDIETVTDRNIPPTGYIANNILYTLGKNDGYAPDVTECKVVALNTRQPYGPPYYDEPGEREFAASFKGLTFVLPAGKGKIYVDARTNGNGVMNVKIGDDAPMTFTSVDEFKQFEIPYACYYDVYVYIYHNISTSSASSRAPRAPGRKETTTTEIRGIKINASSVVMPETPSTTKNLQKGDFTVENGHIIVTDHDITGVDYNAFKDLQGQEITYVDLSQTSMVNCYINRYYEPWASLPVNTFIYLPYYNYPWGGNAYMRNVVVGEICPYMELLPDGKFEAACDFLANKVVQETDYSAMPDNTATVMLPFALDEETAGKIGTFHEFAGIYDDKVGIRAVTSVEANQPYLLKSTATKLEVDNVEVKALSSSEVSASRRAAGNTGLIGTYSPENLSSTESEQYYVYALEGDDAGQFVHAASSLKVAPYQAYLKVEGASFVDKMPVVIAPAYILGDANGDEQVNVTDIVATVNYIMNKPSDDFNKYAADVNGDGEVNVTDIVGMVNIIMKDGK